MKRFHFNALRLRQIGHHLADQHVQMHLLERKYVTFIYKYIKFVY